MVCAESLISRSGFPRAASTKFSFVSIELDECVTSVTFADLVSDKINVSTFLREISQLLPGFSWQC